MICCKWQRVDALSQHGHDDDKNRKSCDNFGGESPLWRSGHTAIGTSMEDAEDEISGVGDLKIELSRSTCLRFAAFVGGEL